jgi:hypothetical protein
MPEEMIPATPDDKPENSQRRQSRSKARQPENAETQRPRGSQHRSPRIPQPAELIDQLQQLAGLAAMGILRPDKANFLLRCIGKIADIAMKCPASAGAISDDAGLVEACRQNPNLINLVESFLTDEQLAELTRQVSQDAP